MKKPLSFKNNKIYRHIFVISLSLLITFLFMRLRYQWSPEMHYQNKAFADVSLIWIILILFIGVGSRLCLPFKRLLPWCKELGIWAIVWALIHIYIILYGFVEWQLPELFGYTFYQAINKNVLVEPGFTLANIIGAIALIYGMAMLITSNEFSLRFLTYPSWKYLHQRSVHLLYVLAAIHTAYFLFFHYAVPQRQSPSNFFQIVFPVLIAVLSTVQALVFIKTVIINRGKE